MPSGSLRIIAGRWRRRRISFDSKADIRPTTDSARETLFNWLQGAIEGAVCLDLFAGSGALGFEALSRGAKEVVLVDSDRRCVRSLNQTAADLESNDCSIVQKDGLVFLRQTGRHFDIVFLDPPFRTQLAIRALSLLHSEECLSPDARIYLETEREFSEMNLEKDWNIVRHFRSGSRCHYLLSRKQEVIEQ